MNAAGLVVIFAVITVAARFGVAQASNAGPAELRNALSLAETTRRVQAEREGLAIVAARQ